MEERPTLVLRAEEELGITAGLQDRVIQVYGGVVYMDFAKEFMQQHDYGRYRGCTPNTTMMHVHNEGHTHALTAGSASRCTEDGHLKAGTHDMASFSPASTHALPPVLCSNGCREEEVNYLGGIS